MTVIGCDLSSFAVDLVVLQDDSDQAAWHRFPLVGKTPFERARSLRSVFPRRSWFEDQGCYLFALEDPYSASKGVAKALGIVTGAVAALLPADLTVVQTKPNEWHALFTGNAKASKDDIRHCVLWQPIGDGFERLRRVSRNTEAWDWPQDAYDAYAIAWAVRKLNDDAIGTEAA